MSQSNPNYDLVRKLAEASGWQIPEDRLQEISALYKSTADDTRPIREVDVTSALPANVFEAE
jgi:hypothetical protein